MVRAMIKGPHVVRKHRILPAVVIAIVTIHFSCIKIESPKPPPDDIQPPHQTLQQSDDGDGELRYYTFNTDRPYSIQFRIRQSDVQAAEALLKEIDKEGLRNEQGNIFGIDRQSGDFLVLYWQCIYNGMYQSNRSVITRLAEVFRQIKTENNLNDLQLIYVIARFVQHMKYYIPPGIGIYSPARVLLETGKGGRNAPPGGHSSGWHGAGDCDTKSLLLAMLLQECGYDAVVLDSYRYQHAMAGVNFPGIDGTAIEFRGKSYYVIESTYPNWSIGQMPQQYTDLNYFHPINPAETHPAVAAALSRASALGMNSATLQGPGEREPNNDIASSDRTSEMIIDGHLSESDTVDWFRLSGQESTFASFTIVHEPGAVFNFEVYNDNSPVAHARGTGASDTVSCEIPGVCHVKVYRVSGTGPYSLVISPGGASEKEPNDQPGDADSVSVASIFSEIQQPGDIDWFILAGQEGFNATYTIHHAPENQFGFEVFNDGASLGKFEGPSTAEGLTVEHPGRVTVKITGKTGTGWYLLKILRNR